MKVRFQADADLKHAIVRATLRREPVIDFQNAVAAGLTGRDDIEVLTIAAREGRVLVSHDNRTMPTHFAQFIAHNTSLEAVSPFLRLVRCACKFRLRTLRVRRRSWKINGVRPAGLLMRNQERKFDYDSTVRRNHR